MALKTPKHHALIAIAFAAALTASASARPFDEVSNKSAENPLASYQSVYIAPVQVDLGDDVRRDIRDLRSPRPVTEIDQGRRAERLQRDLTRAFDKKFTLAEAPGEGILTVEATLTGLRSTRPTLAELDVNSQTDFGNSIYAGGADYAVRLIEEDDVLVEIEERDQTFLNDGRPRIGLWQDADRSSRRFSSRLARYVKNN
ncbi:MAG: DUF3313 family protein [Pseudomonadota bacterium]